MDVIVQPLKHRATVALEERIGVSVMQQLDQLKPSCSPGTGSEVLTPAAVLGNLLIPRLCHKPPNMAVLPRWPLASRPPCAGSHWTTQLEWDHLNHQDTLSGVILVLVSGLMSLKLHNYQNKLLKLYGIIYVGSSFSVKIPKWIIGILIWDAWVHLRRLFCINLSHVTGGMSTSCMQNNPPMESVRTRAGWKGTQT